MRLRALLIILMGLGFFLTGYMVTARGKDLPQGQLKLEVAPAAADISVDGKSIKPGEKEFDIGPHKVSITMDGFESYETVVNITQGAPAYIGVILDSNNPYTKDWFDNNADDRKLSESISSQASDSSSEETIRKYPIFSVLPVVFGNGAGGLTKIDSESALNGSGKPSIGIYASTPQQRQQALDWIGNRNYTISDLDVVFYGARIPIRSGSAE